MAKHGDGMCVMRVCCLSYLSGMRMGSVSFRKSSLEHSVLVDVMDGHPVSCGSSGCKRTTIGNDSFSGTAAIGCIDLLARTTRPICAAFRHGWGVPVLSGSIVKRVSMRNLTARLCLGTSEHQAQMPARAVKVASGTMAVDLDHPCNADGS